MPNNLSTTLYHKYRQYILSALQETSEDFRDLPPLSCGRCGKCAHFGGIDTFLESRFTINDVCDCEFIYEQYIVPRSN